MKRDLYIYEKRPVNGEREVIHMREKEWRCGVRVWERDVYIWKETYIYEKRPIYVWREAYVCEKNPLNEPKMRVCLVCERDRVETCLRKRPTFMKRDLYICKRDLYINEKRPVWIEAYLYGKKRPRNQTYIRVCLVWWRKSEDASQGETCIVQKYIYIWKRDVYIYKQKPVCIWIEAYSYAKRNAQTNPTCVCVWCERERVETFLRKRRV